MILSTGIDIIEINRIEKAILKNYNIIFKILHKNEINEIKQMKDQSTLIKYVAKRFAIKEALTKAIGCGIFSDNISMQEIEIKKDNKGKPFIIQNIKITDCIRKFFHTSEYNIHISISDSSINAVGICIIELAEKILIKI